MIILKGKQYFLFPRNCSTDIIFLQKTHSCKEDERFWKSQWGDTIFFSHGSNHSAGVAVLFNRFASNEGWWIILVLKGKKRNRKRNITSLNINGIISSDPNIISNHITSFYNNRYTSNFN